MNLVIFLLLAAFSTARAVTEMEIVWMLDDSYSIARGNYENAKIMIDDVNQMILDDDRYTNSTKFGLLEFGSRITGYESLTYDYDLFYEQLDENRFGSAGSTAMPKAFTFVNKYMFNENKTSDRRIIAIVTDGAPNPGQKYGGENLIRAVNETFQLHGLDRLVYIMVSNSIGRRKANSNQFVKVHEYYNKTEDFVPINFKRQVDEDTLNVIFCKLVNCMNDTYTPTTAPTMSPTYTPTISPTYTPTDTPTSSPTTGPTTSPTDAPTLHKYDDPTDAPSAFTPAPHSHVDNGLSAGAIAGIVLGLLLLILVFVLIGYKIGNENN